MFITRLETLTLVFGLLAIFFAPFYFLFYTPLPIDSLGAMTAFQLVELLIYFAFVIVNCQTPKFHYVIIESFLLLATRMVVCFATTLLVLPLELSTGNLGIMFLRVWIGHPLSALLQVFLLVLLAPRLFAVILPWARTQAEQETSDTSFQPAQRVSSSTLSYTDMMQLDSFEDLAGFLKKISGLVGFVLFDKAGESLWSDVPDEEPFNPTLFANRFSRLTEAVSNALTQLEIVPPDRSFVGTNNYKIFFVKPNDSYGLIVLVSKETLFQKFYNKLDLIQKCVDEFLRKKYPESFQQ